MSKPGLAGVLERYDLMDEATPSWFETRDWLLAAIERDRLLDEVARLQRRVEIGQEEYDRSETIGHQLSGELAALKAENDAVRALVDADEARHDAYCNDGDDCMCYAIVGAPTKIATRELRNILSPPAIQTEDSK